jgi:hypothetical protein
MDLSEFLAVSGKPGLNKMISQGKNNIIVESLAEKKRFPVYGTQQVSSLEEISVYTYGEDVPLKDVFKSIFEKKEGGKAPDIKAKPEVLKQFMEEILPDYDKERVYVSDIKKLVKWYNELQEHDLLDFSEEEEETNEEEGKEDEKQDEEEKPTEDKNEKSE